MSRGQRVPQLPVPAEEFKLTEQHIALLRRAQIGWREPTMGAFGPLGVGGPAVHGVRPYGDSNIGQSIADICGIPYDPDVLYSQGPESDALRARLMALHEETKTALQIVLETGTFTPGHYFRQHCCPWAMVPVLDGNAARISTRPLTQEMVSHLVKVAHAAVTMVGSGSQQQGTYFTLDRQEDVETALAYLREQRILHGYELVPKG